MAYAAIPVKTKSCPGFILVAALFACLAYFAPANASKSPNLDRALAHLLDAQSASDVSQQTAALNAALEELNRASNKQKGPALAWVQSAISDLNEQDAGKVNEDVTKAIAAICKVTGDDPAKIAETPKPPPPAPAPPADVGKDSAFGTPTTSPDHPAPTVALTGDQARAVVLIKGDNAEGTGFLVKMPDGPVVITNIHVISNNPNLQITSSTGAPITIVSYKGATDRDLAMIAIKDGSYSYLPLATDVSATVKTGDEVITPGNSQGGEVMLNTDGKVLGLGPVRVEFDNPIYHGNSGGPVIHVKSGTVIGVVTEAVEVDVTNALDKASFANRNSAISHSMRYFGMRIDTVPKWEPYDWRSFQAETAFLDQFDKRNHALDTLLNAPNDNKPEDTLYRNDEKIMKAAYNYYAQISGGADVSQRMMARREFVADLNDIADTDMDAIQNANNFYSFDQLRTKDEIAYRKALKTELENTNNDISLLDSASRSNN